MTASILNVRQVLPASAQNQEAYEIRVAQAYQATFSGTGSRDDAALVLVDLAQFSRYYDTAGLDLTGEMALALSQRRAVFSRVLEALTKTGVSVDGLHAAVIDAPEIT